MQRFFESAARLMRPNGLLTVYTDNLWYGKLLTRQLGASIGDASKTSMKSKNRVDMVRQMRSITMDQVKKFEYEGSWNEEFVYQNVVLFKGSPGKQCGHFVDASSYFDRLWKHGNRNDRYMIVLQKK